MTPPAGFFTRAPRSFLSLCLVSVWTLVPLVQARAADTDCPDTADACRLIAHWGRRDAAASPDGLDFGSESFSVACWFRAEKGDPGGCLVRKGSPDHAAGFHLETDIDGRVEAGVRAASSVEALRFRTLRTVTDGSWHHVAVVINRQTAQAAIHIDGRICELEQAAGSGGALNDEGVVLHFDQSRSRGGPCAPSPVELAPGMGTPGAPRCVEDIRIYRGALTAEAVKTLFHETTAIASSGGLIDTRLENGTRKPFFNHNEAKWHSPP